MKEIIWSYRNLSATVWVPAVDIYENERNVLVLVDMAGVDPDQTKITLENQTILITGQRPRPSPGGVVRIHQMEIDAGVFKRRIPLPGPVDSDSIECTYKDGLLRIVLPKKPRQEMVRIPVESQ
ncbi:MAG: Hsp20/alpha crystallin family protein [Deltaproteobacteria bacterium]|nr:Hsp20/alpha crystallin family protein [Deltaproteobacteria bacterium]MBW2120907.1 Hsp20/alpha crystallin family protein [Deltaproteobacteria bacterium]